MVVRAAELVVKACEEHAQEVRTSLDKNDARPPPSVGLQGCARAPRVRRRPRCHARFLKAK
eukprot:8438068-Lingulodinium_polyedra.AAC.1